MNRRSTWGRTTTCCSAACPSASNGSIIQSRRPPWTDTEDDPASGFGNYVAIGTLDPEIEIFSISLLESVYPDAVFGAPKETAAHVPEPAGTGKKKRKKRNTCYQKRRPHRRAVGLVAGYEGGHPAQLCEKPHKDKAQAVQRNPTVPSVLLSGSHNRTVRVFDSRAPDAGVGAIVGANF
jgi:periodic tryptophan protein 1